MLKMPPDDQPEDQLPPASELEPEPESLPEPEPDSPPMYTVEEVADQPPADQDMNQPQYQSEYQPEYEPQPQEESFRPHSGPASRDYFQFPQAPRRKLPLPLIAGVIGALVVIGLVVKLIFSSSASTPPPSPQDVLIETTTGQTTPSPSPSDADSELPAKDELKIQVLNGSGVVGAAGKLAAVLEDDDYPKADTANASTFDAKGVKIEVKDGLRDIGDQIETLLTDNDFEDITVRESLDADNDYDVIITLGKQGSVQGTATSSADLKQSSDKSD